MGRKNTDTTKARTAMRELWLSADAYARNNDVHEGLNDQIVAAEVDTGVDILRVMDQLSITAEMTRNVGGVLCDCEVIVEFGPDMRDLPEVWEVMYSEGRAESRTVARRDFPEIARSVMRLIPQDVTA